ncbi:alpha-amylase family glycosyl hydrolase, partial [Haemophilus influenzae]|uniref:alpha-amylase family glycosyl hydrolase n=1 Tax=Haemophilus influenzae TaxID=727 RepID=UPI0018E38FD3
DWYSFSDDGTALDWLGYASLPKLDYQSESLVNEIYRGEDSIVRHWLKAPWNMDGWRLDVVHMLGEAGGARNNLQHVAGITEAAKETQPEATGTRLVTMARRSTGWAMPACRNWIISRKVW